MSREKRVEMPSYTCHKTVKASKIRHVRYLGDMGFEIYLEDIDDTLLVTNEWHDKHEVGNMTGGYIVEYKDGYISYSPAGAFEKGYTKNE